MATGIERAGYQHAAVLAALHRHILTPTPSERPWTSREFADLLGTPAGCALIASPEGPGEEPIGFAIATFAGGEGDLLFIGVAPEGRRLGVARALLDALLTRAREAGLVRLMLEVAEDNAPARLLYERAGFRAVARRPGYYSGSGQSGQASPKVDAIVMEYKL